MNKYTLGIAFTLGLLTSSVLFAQQVTINITAKVMDSTCSISSDTTNLNVGMDSGNLKGKDIGVPFGQTKFSINLDNCPQATTTAHVKLTGESDSLLPNLLKVVSNADANAKGIAIGLYDKNERNLDIRNNLTDFIIDHTSSKHALEFVAAYVRTSDQYSAGKVTAVASFEIAYD